MLWQAICSTSNSNHWIMIIFFIFYYFINFFLHFCQMRVAILSKLPDLHLKHNWSEMHETARWHLALRAEDACFISGIEDGDSPTSTASCCHSSPMQTSLHSLGPSESLHSALCLSLMSSSAQKQKILCILPWDPCTLLSSSLTLSLSFLESHLSCTALVFHLSGRIPAPSHTHGAM